MELVMDWQQQLILAAARRARVKLRSGAEGVLVYAPGTERSRAKANHPVRHGNRTQCGVRLSDSTGKVTSVDPGDILEILGEVNPDA